MKPSPHPTPPLALIIDDEVQIRRLLRVALESAGYEVEEAGLAKTALAVIALKKPHVVILDLGLPDMEGAEALRRLREWSQVPVLVASVRDHAHDKIKALDAGADDYVTKPFDTEELLARLRAIQRRANSEENLPLLEVGALMLDLSAHEARMHGQPLKLTPTEFAILKVLATFAGRIITHAQLLQAIWGPGSGDQVNSLRVHINGLRRKFSPQGVHGLSIVNEPGIGYRLVTTGT